MSTVTLTQRYIFFGGLNMINIFYAIFLGVNFHHHTSGNCKGRVKYLILIWTLCALLLCSLIAANFTTTLFFCENSPKKMDYETLL